MYRSLFPYAASGTTIGLFGGSFDPPHEGHVLVTKRALRRLGLDQVWWLFSPGNPLKSHQPASIEKRIAAARMLFDHPRVVYSDLETNLPTRFTVDTVTILCRLYPKVQFVWIMGADNLTQFHKWDRWREIFSLVPIAVMARPGEQLRAGLSPAARMYRDYRLQPSAAQALKKRETPAWVMLTGASVDRSSSEIRAQGAWE